MLLTNRQTDKPTLPNTKPPFAKEVIGGKNKYRVFGKIMFLVVLVCLFVSNITQNIMNRLQ